MKFLYNQNSEPVGIPDAFNSFFNPVWTQSSFEKILIGSNFDVKIEHNISGHWPPNCLRVKAEHSNKIVSSQDCLKSNNSHLPLNLNNLCIADGIFDAFGEYQLGISTADCLAVAYLLDISAGCQITALVHAGWKGFCAGIHLKAIQMIGEAAHQKFNLNSGLIFPKLQIHISPAVFGISYECGEDVLNSLNIHFKNRRKKFINWSSELESIWHTCSDVEVKNDIRNSIFPKNKNLLNELKVFPDFQLLAACEFVGTGIDSKNISIFRENTYENLNLPSYRASAHGHGDGSKRMTTMLTPKILP